MPNLKVLHINLHEEEQVDYLLRTLVHLEYLNGLAVERDALFNEDEEDQEEGDDNQMLHDGEDEEEEIENGMGMGNN
jgi:hypothetical protein